MPAYIHNLILKYAFRLFTYNKHRDMCPNKANSTRHYLCLIIHRLFIFLDAQQVCCYWLQDKLFNFRN